MVKKCCVLGCRSESYRDCGITFFNFPKTDPLRQLWINAVPGRVKNYSVVCHFHFKSDDILATSSRPKLTSDAVPSIFCTTKRKINEEIDTRNEDVNAKSRLYEERDTVIENGCVKSKTYEEEDTKIIQDTRELYEKRDLRIGNRSSKRKLYEENYTRLENGDTKRNHALAIVKENMQNVPRISKEPLSKQGLPDDANDSITIQNLQKQIKILKDRLKRRDDRIKDLKSILKMIQHDCSNFYEVESVLESNLEDID